MKDDLINSFASFLLIEQSVSEKTVEVYCRDVNQFFKFFEGDVDEVEDSDLHHYVREISRFSANTVARKITSIRSFFRFLCSRGIIDHDPTTKIEMPKMPRRLPVVLSIPEVTRIIEGVVGKDPLDLRDRAMLETIYGCGLRISELISVKMSDLSLKEKFLRVMGKGEKERLVPIGDKAILAIRGWLGKGRPMVAKGANPFLFLNHRGRKLSRMGAWKIIKKYVIMAGIDRRVTPHTFRHTFATHLLEGGANLRAVQEMLGHADIGTTQIYLHVDRETLREVHRLYHPRG